MSRLAAVLTFVLLTSCSPTPMPNMDAPGTIVRTQGDTPGYQHGVDRSKFVAGQTVRQRFADGYVRWEGDNGVFAVNPVSGAAVGTLTSARLAATEAAGTAPPSAEKHALMVRDYFLNAGVPADQIAGVDDLTLLAERGEVRSKERAQPVIIGYISALRRQIGEVPVPDSVAWARIDERGVVLGEGVHWPAIPKRTIEDARELRALAADPARLRTVMTALPAEATDGKVAIRHTHAASRSAPIAVAVYVVQFMPPGDDPRGVAKAPVELNFDRQGKRVVLPSEREPAAPETPRR